MRAAAGIIEESALPGLSATCTSQEITVQVPEASGDPAERAAQVGRLARIAGSHAYRDDSRVTAYAEVKANGQARGIPVSIFTPLQVRTRPGSTGRSRWPAAPAARSPSSRAGSSWTGGGGSPSSTLTRRQRQDRRRADGRQDCGEPGHHR